MREDRPLLLLIDDDPDDRALARIVLERELPAFAVQEIADAPSLAQACGRGRFRALVLEQTLAWADGLAIVATLKEDWPEVPMILFTREGSAEASLKAMRLGADDYLVKSTSGFLRLPLAVRSALEKASRREEAAAEPAGPLEALPRQAGAAVFSATPRGKLLNASPGFLQLLGVDSLEAAGRLDLEPLVAAAGEVPATSSRDAPGPTSAREVIVRRADGSPLRLEVIGTLVQGADGPRVDGLVEEVTGPSREDDRAEEEAARSSARLQRADPELQQLATLASHELQEPVRTIERYARILREDYRGRIDPGADELIEALGNSARRLQELIDDLLAFSRLERREPRRERVGAESLLQRALADLSAAVEASGATVTCSGLPEIVADPVQIAQLFQNLLANALKFRGEEPPRVTVSARRAPREWVFSVRDNGIGIDPAEAEAIFDMFVRLHPEVPGSGVGLAICKKIVERHGGRIWAHSEPGRGSTFSFSIPAVERDKDGAGNDVL